MIELNLATHRYLNDIQYDRVPRASYIRANNHLRITGDLGRDELTSSAATAAAERRRAGPSGADRCCSWPPLIQVKLISDILFKYNLLTNN